MTSTSSLEGYLATLLTNNLILPASLSYLTVVGLAFLSIALMFKGSVTWKALFVALGAYYGYIFALYIVSYFSSTGLPVYLILVIGAVIGAVLMTFFVRVALAGGFALVTYILAGTLYTGSFVISVGVAIIAFVLVYFLYNRVTVMISGVIGAFMLWFCLLSVGLSPIEAQVVPAILFPLGLYLQIIERKNSHRRFATYSR